MGRSPRFETKQELVAWLQQPAPVGDAPLSRYLRIVFESQATAQHAFGELQGDAATQFLCWAVAEYRVPAEFIPPDGVGLLNAPASRGSRWGVTRLLEHIHRVRPDLQQAFPDLEGEGGQAFINWALETAGSEYGLPPHLLPGVAAPGNGTTPEAYAVTGQAPSLDAPDWGVNVLGFVRAELGIGTATRLVADGLEAAGVPVLREPCGEELLGHREGTTVVPQPVRAPAGEPYGFNLVGLNGPELAHVSSELKRFGGRYTIGSWWWEVHDSLPDTWLLGCLPLDEVWVASQHIAEALRPFIPVPVRKITLPVIQPVAASIGRADLGLPDGFLFLFVFDYFSTLARKNPLGVIKAFRRAFPPGSGAKLILKSINGDHASVRRELVKGMIRDHPDIVMFDGLVPAETKNAFVAACDCYVSLHRAEGFGLPLAEAMSLGKPVIATGYSGNLEFMTEDNSYLVEAALTEIGDETADYPSGGVWGEPDLDHAATLMRSVFANPDEAWARGARAAEHIAHSHSLRSAGESMLARLLEIEQQLAAPPAGTAST
jgi:glycosyltransferase involved in cell wall biosynthesis